MDNSASQALVTSEEQEVKSWLVSMQCPENIAGTIAMLMVFLRQGAAQVAASHPSYLQLPAPLAAVAADWRYQAALPHGRFRYRDEQYDYDEARDELVRVPLSWSREEIGEMIRSFLTPADPRMAAATPLAWRVGFLVGWLSALSVSQKEDAQAGMVVLAALVTPLLLGNVAAQGETKLLPRETKLGKRSTSRAGRSGSVGKSERG